MICDAPDLLQPDGVRALIRQLQPLGPLSLVFIDTLARATPGANKNSGEDMGKALGHSRTIRQITGPLVCLIHHSGKDQAKGARGSQHWFG